MKFPCMGSVSTYIGCICRRWGDLISINLMSKDIPDEPRLESGQFSHIVDLEGSRHMFLLVKRVPDSKDVLLLAKNNSDLDELAGVLGDMTDEN